jgi:hypothetical protein
VDARAWDHWRVSGAASAPEEQGKPSEEQGKSTAAAAAAVVGDAGEAVFKLLGQWQAAQPSS